MKRLFVALTLSGCIAPALGATPEEISESIGTVGRYLEVCKPQGPFQVPKLECLSITTMALQAGAYISVLAETGMVERPTPVTTRILAAHNVEARCRERAPLGTIVNVVVKRIKAQRSRDSDPAFTAIISTFADGPICKGTKQ